MHDVSQCTTPRISPRRAAWSDPLAGTNSDTWRLSPDGKTLEVTQSIKVRAPAPAGSPPGRAHPANTRVPRTRVLTHPPDAGRGAGA